MGCHKFPSFAFHSRGAHRDAPCRHTTMSDTDALERAYVRVVMAITSRPEMRGYAAAMIAKLADVLEDPRGVPPSACPTPYVDM
jgi:hypothetical protein